MDISRDYYTSDAAWERKGKELLNAVQDVDAELKVTNRNVKFLVAALPFSVTGLVIPATFTFFAFNLIVILAMVACAIATIANCVLLTETLSRAGKIKYEGSLLHNLERARRNYHAWLEEDARPKPPKPEPKLVTKEVVPKIMSRKIDDLEDTTTLIDGSGREIRKEFNIICTNCGGGWSASTIPGSGNVGAMVQHIASQHILEGVKGCKTSHVKAVSNAYSREY